MSKGVSKDLNEELLAFEKLESSKIVCQYRNENGGTYIFTDGTVISGDRGDGVALFGNGLIYWKNDSKQRGLYLLRRANVIDYNGNVRGIPKNELKKAANEGMHTKQMEDMAMRVGLIEDGIILGIHETNKELR